jgi:hypothetical protein
MKLSHAFITLSLTLYTIVGCKSKDIAETAHPESAISVLPTELNLPPELQILLKKEMVEIQSAMQQLIPLMSQGNSEITAQLAEQIKSSFILKKSLSPEELKQLVQLLPPHFVQLDRTFHGNAGKLAESAKQSDFIESGKIYGTMISACIECHTQFAPERFPNLNKIKNSR